MKDKLIEKIFGQEGVNYNYWFKQGRLLNFINWLNSYNPNNGIKQCQNTE